MQKYRAPSLRDLSAGALVFHNFEWIVTENFRLAASGDAGDLQSVGLRLEQAGGETNAESLGITFRSCFEFAAAPNLLMIGLIEQGNREGLIIVWFEVQLHYHASGIDRDGN